MVIVPGFAAAAITNLYEIFRFGFTNFINFLKELFVLNNGNFFLIFVLNNAGGTFWTSIICSGLLFKHYLSPNIVVASTLYERVNQGYRKHNGMLFGWGPNYAINLVIAAIGVMFQ